MIRQVCKVITLLVTCMPLIYAGYLEYQDNGEPFRWSSSKTIDWIYEDTDFCDSNCGVNISGSEIQTIIQNSVNHWNEISPASLSFGSGSPVPTTNATPVDINLSNFQNYADLNNITCPAGLTTNNYNLVFIIDHDGEIFNSILSGSGINPLNILGLASPSGMNKTTGEISCGYVLINALPLKPTPAEITANAATPAVLKTLVKERIEYVITHELGHALNMVHTQVNADSLDSPTTVPIMYPFLPSDPSTALTVPLKLDDQFSYLYLYNQEQLANEGGITGTVKDRFNQGFLGANVICRDTISPLVNVVSWVSDANLNGDGDYMCGHLPSGDYQVSIEPIQVAINIWDTLPPFIVSEYYNEDESHDPKVDLRTDATDITVDSTPVSDINMIINENGRLISGLTVKGSLKPDDLAPISYFAAAPFEYFIDVPRYADSITFELKNDDDTDKDIDLLGRCGQPYSLDISSSGYVFSVENPASDQTQFSSLNDNSGHETITLNKSSNPPLPKGSQCHLLVANLTDPPIIDADFTITATVQGKTPTLTFEFVPKNSVQENDQTVIAQIKAYARGDKFVVSRIKFTDEGEQGLSNATGVYLYIDQNANGKVDSKDTLIGSTTTVSATGVTIEIDGLYFLDEENKTLLLAYDQPVAASTSGLWLTLLIISLVLFALQKMFPKLKLTCWMILLVGSSVQCSSGGSSAYSATIAAKSDVKVTALGFGDKFNVRTDNTVTVQEFFED